MAAKLGVRALPLLDADVHGFSNAQLRWAAWNSKKMLCNVREFRATDIAELTGLCPMLLCDDMGTAWAFSMEKRFTVVMRKGRVHLGSDGTKR